MCYTFDAGPNADWSSQRVEQRMHELADADGAIARSDGDGKAALHFMGNGLHAR